MSANPVKALCILVMEDDFNVGSLLADLLKVLGHDVCAIERTVTDAVSAAARYRPDLMIVEERLYDGSGIAAVDEIIRQRPVPYLFVTGDVWRVKALRPDAIVIQKPFGEPALTLAIKRALETAVARPPGTRYG
jgi:DNA-binding response OmpR family regulator